MGEGGSEREGVRGRKEYMYKEEGLERGMMEETREERGERKKGEKKGEKKVVVCACKEKARSSNARKREVGPERIPDYPVNYLLH